MIKFSFEETVEYFNQCGFWVLDEYVEDIHIGDKLNIQDSEGYRYYLSRHKLHGGLLNSKKLGVVYFPQRYALQNPYTVDNIILWMKNNNCAFAFHHGEYRANDVPTLFFQCNKSGHIWNNPWSVIQSGTGCPYCNGKRVSDMRNLGTERPDLIDEWDNDRNEKSIFEVTPRSRKNYWWICSFCNHKWEATASNRNALTQEKCSNCPRCSKSHGEKEVERILKFYELNYVFQCKFEGCKYKKSLFFDFYLPDFNCCIEYNGQQHYRPGNFWFNNLERSEEELRKQKIKDEIKRKFCEKEGILFIIIPYWEFNIIEDVLVSRLNLTKIL
jgi:hypothetical protein